MPLLRTLIGFLITSLAASALAQQPAAPPPAKLPPVRIPIRPAQLERFEKDMARMLYKSMNKAGHWDLREVDLPANDDKAGGTTALVVYALLSAGETTKKPELARAIEWMKKSPTKGVYVAGVKLNAYQYLPSASIKDASRFDYQYLLRSMIPAQDPKTRKANVNAGLFDYTEEYTADRHDHSVSQYAVLGLWAADQIGQTAPDYVWRLVEQGWLRDQNADGGWSYEFPANQQPSSGSMTAAGITSLFIAQDHLRSLGMGSLRGTPGYEACERGLAWMTKNFTPDGNPFGPQQHYVYWLYGVERVGLTSGLKRFGDRVWFDEGARSLAAKYYSKGALNAEFMSDDNSIRDVAFTLLFLARGRKPILVNKLKYDGPWNERPREAANIAKWYGKRFENEVVWQIAALDGAPEDMHDAPVLFMNGGSGFELTAENKTRLRGYIDGGGLLWGNANQESPEWADSFKKLIDEIVPEYPWRTLPANHPIITGAGGAIKDIPIMAKSNGIRELVVFTPKQDPPRAWQSAREKDRADLYNVAANVFFYASDRGRLRTRNENYYVVFDPSVSATRKASVARVKYAGQWNPEPGAWRRMAAIFHNQHKLDLGISDIALGDRNLAGHNFAHLTGISAISLTDEQAGDLRSFIVRGGTLIVDSAGGSAAFAESAERELAKVIPNAQWEELSIDEPILADAHPLPEPITPLFGEDEVKPAPMPDKELEVEYRRYAKAKVAGLSGLKLKGIRVGRRWAVLFTPYDLTVGMVGQPIDGIIGYTPATATEIVRRVVVNSAPK